LAKYTINPDIRKAETLPGSFYQDSAVFDQLREKVFVKTWQWIGDESQLPLGEAVSPFVLLDHFLTEPLLLSRDAKGEVHCLSNVCTHRGNIVAHHPGQCKQLLCQYHGRRYELTGAFKSMPEFKEAENFPRPCDDLKKFELRNLGPHLFTSLDPSFDLKDTLSWMNERIGFLPLEQFKHRPDLSKDYLVNCHWALYCDNYLEGFHIPFVHPDLNAVLDYTNYVTELTTHGNLQIGQANSGEEVFDLPRNHPDYGKHIGAYYYWLFPNMMFNFYPWGLSINVVRPLTKDKTKVSFITYVWDESKLERGAGALLDKVEREDEFVVEGVHQGLKSRFYPGGRFSPTREKGVHHFHRLLADFMG
jgi:choline monooxygenase